MIVAKKENSQRLFIIGGILLIISGMIFGDIFAVFILHPNIANISLALSSAAEAAMSQNVDAVYSHMQNLGSYLENAGTKIDTHVHIIKFGYFALLLALIQPYIAFSEQCKIRLAQLFLTGAVLLPPSVFLIHYVGLAYSPFESIGWASIAADFGGLLIIIAVAAELFGLLRYYKTANKEEHVQEKQTQSSLWESRVLLAAGSVMLLLGFLFGAYYAGTKLEHYEEHEIIALQDTLSASMDNNQQNVQQSLNDYGLIQANKGISIAAPLNCVDIIKISYRGSFRPCEAIRCPCC